LFGGQTWISRGVDHLAEELGEVQPTVMCSVPRVYEKMYAAVMARVREAPGYRRALFTWAVGVGTRHSHDPQAGGLLAAQYRVADALVLAALRKRLTGGRLRFFISGGAALSREIEEFFWAIGVPILNGWGMTEMSSGACSNTLQDHRFLTVGKPFPGVELKIADDGEILVKSPGNMLGYHKNDEATAETLRDGWIYTGDIGEIDGEGFLHITDRKKALFKTAVGKYIAPQPLEFGLMRDSLIERAVIVGEGRPYVTALVVPDWEALATQLGLVGEPAQLRLDPRCRELVQRAVDECNRDLAGFETIKRFALLLNDFSEQADELTPTLKPKRRVIAAHYADEIAALYAAPREAVGA